MHCPLCHGEKTSHYLNIDDGFRGNSDYFQCSECDLIFLDPARRLSPDAEKARYDLHQNSLDDPGYVDFLNRLVNPLCEMLSSGAKGFDFGCGPAPVLSVLMERKGYRMSFYDPFYAPDLDWRKQSWRFITCTEVLEHLFEPGSVIADLDRTLAGPGSLIAVMTQLFSEEIDFKDWWYRKDPTHVCFYSRRSFNWIAGNFEYETVYPDKNVIFLIKK